MKDLKTKKYPIRMCVVCRNRFLQEKLNRMQCINKELLIFKGTGRSFYVCNDCINNKRFINYISKKCNLNKEEVKKELEKIGKG